MSAPSTVLVTGATGFTGSVLVRKLAAAGHSVRAIARPSSDISPFDGLDIAWFRGDVYDPALTAQAASGAEYIFHMVTAYRHGAASDDLFRRLHVDSTKLLAGQAAAATGFKRFVHISTIGVHGHITGPPADETAPFAPGDSYQQTKVEGEVWLRNFALERNLPVTILRPAAIYGPGDRRLLKLFRMATRRVFPLLGFGPCYYHLIHVEDLANIMMLAAAHPAAVGETFICGNPEPTTLAEIGRVIAGELGHSLVILRLPAFPFFAVAAMAEVVFRPFGLDPPIYRRRIAFFTKDRKFNTDKLKKVLGYETVYSNREGLVQTLNWYREHGWL
jgi:nucleoside-diphosphate-sugar epimerase